MKRFLSFVTTFFVCALLSVGIYAQESNTVSAGSVISETGKAVTFISGGFVLATGGLFVNSHLKTVSGNGDLGTGISQIAAILFMAYGGVGMVAGGAMWLTGDLVLRHNGDSFVSFVNEQCRGFGMIMDLGYCTESSISPRIALGYNFSKHIFLGAGSVCYINMDASRRPFDSLPVFAAGRFSPGNGFVSPYVDVNVGVDTFNSCKLYYALGGGARFRLSNRQNALSLGTLFESGPLSNMVGARLSYTF